MSPLQRFLQLAKTTVDCALTAWLNTLICLPSCGNVFFRTLATRRGPRAPPSALFSPASASASPLPPSAFSPPRRRRRARDKQDGDDDRPLPERSRELWPRGAPPPCFASRFSMHDRLRPTSNKHVPELSPIAGAAGDRKGPRGERKHPEGQPLPRCRRLGQRRARTPRPLPPTPPRSTARRSHSLRFFRPTRRAELVPQHLGNVLRGCLQLQSLNLSGNALGDNGAKEARPCCLSAWRRLHVLCVSVCT